MAQHDQDSAQLRDDYILARLHPTCDLPGCDEPAAWLVEDPALRQRGCLHHGPEMIDAARYEYEEVIIWRRH